MTERMQAIGQNGNTGASYFLDKSSWLKHTKRPIWRFGKYSIWWESVAEVYMCSFGHVVIGESKESDKARELCGIHAGAIE